MRQCRLWHTKLPVKGSKLATFGAKFWRRVAIVVTYSVCIWSEEAEVWSCERTKPNDSAGLEGAGLEYRRKAHWELEAKIQQVFFEAYNSATRNKVSRKTWIEELHFRLAKMSDETKFTQLKSTSNSYLKHETQRKCSIVWTWMFNTRTSLMLIVKSCLLIHRLSVPGEVGLWWGIWWDRRHEQLSTSSSLNLSLLFIPTTNWTIACALVEE